MESPSTYFSGFNINDLLYLGEAALRTLWISFWAISIGSFIGIFLGLALSVSRFVAYTLGAVLDVFRSVPLIIQLVLFFNFAPIIDIEQGIPDYIDWFLNQSFYHDNLNINKKFLLDTKI